MAKEDPYLASPSRSVKSPMDLADEELEKMLQKHLGRRPEPLSRVLKRASDPAPLPASLEDSRIGKKVTEFPEEIQKRLLSLYLVGLQPGIHPPEEESELVHLTSDGIWHPVIGFCKASWRRIAARRGRIPLPGALSPLLPGQIEAV